MIPQAMTPQRERMLQAWGCNPADVLMLNGRPAEEQDIVKLFVGTSANGEDSEAEIVLEYTARKFCSLPLELTWMRQSANGPWSGWKSNARGRTPFSSYRWALPSVCNFQGRAAYSDVDFIYTSDLAELWNQPIPAVGLIRNPKGKLSTSCIVFDCAKAKGHVPDLEALRRMPDAHSEVLDYFRKHPGLLTAFDGKWDCIDYEKDFNRKQPWTPETIKSYHYTRMSSQVHLKHALPRLKNEGRTHWYTGEVHDHPRAELQELFDGLLAEAIAAGYSVDQYRVERFDGATRRNFVYASENRR